jgi:hypothetical protein
MPLLTPDRPANSSKDQFRAWRRARKCRATAAETAASSVDRRRGPDDSVNPDDSVDDGSVNKVSFAVSIML